MHFIEKTKGAVSIFLVIILLPTMTIAGLFVDLSRVAISQEVVSTSADLALNTVLSDYDKDLKDYFGLLASCQNTEEVIALSKQYFIDSMVSAGVTTSDGEAYYDELASLFTEGTDIQDMLQLSIDGEVNIQGTTNGAMNNPALLKEGIVEFMKYRAPVNGVADLFSKLTESDVADRVEKVSKETELTEAKKSFYEAEERLIKQAEKAYEAIKNYENYKTWTNNKITDEQFLNNFSSFIASPDGSGNSFESTFRYAHEKMVLNLFNTHYTDGTFSVSLIKTKYITNPGTISTYSDSKKASADDIQKLLKEFNTALKNYKASNDSLNAAWSSVGGKQNSDYAIQYWVALSSSCSAKYADYATKASNLWRASQKLNNAITYADAGVMDTLVKSSDFANSYVTFDEPDLLGNLTLKSLCDSFNSYYNGNFKTAVTTGGSTAFKNITYQIRLLDTSDNNAKLALSSVSNIYNIRNNLEKYRSDFETARDRAKEARDATNKLKKCLEDYKKAYDDWKEIAYDPELMENSDLAAEDRKAIEELEETGVDLFSEASVTELYTRLDNIYDLFDTFKKDVEGIKYQNTPVKNITNYTSFRSAANLDASKIVRNESSLRAYATNSFSFTIGKQIQRIEVHDNQSSSQLSAGDAYVITDSFHPNLQKTKLELYDWLRKKFENPPKGINSSSQLTGDVNSKDSANSAKDKISDKSEDVSSVSTSENTEGKSFSEWSGAALPSNAGDGEKQEVTAVLSEISDYVASIFSNFSETFENSLVNMRDDLFAMDYMFSMFTYDTFDNEGCYSKLDESVQKDLTAVNAKSKYETVFDSKWKNSNENKTLTLTPRNANYNWAYGGEIEYILYGNKSNADNKQTAYANIYMIRYALDLPAVFNVYWKDDVPLNTLATALQTWAFIPAPLTKTLACLAITAAEAAVDINSLRLGLPVTLIKVDKADLVCNYQNIFNGEKQNQTDITDKITLQYSDYLKIFMFIKLIGSGEKKIYARIGDVIQANMTLATGNDDYALSKAQVYYDLDAKVLVAPMWSRLLAVDDLGDLSTEKNWRSIHINITRGY